jgi:hypothetical protein
MGIAQLAGKLREQIHRFSGDVSRGLCKTARRFVEEMVYGIQARGSVRLSEVARSLDEPIALKKTHARLSRQLDREGLGEAVVEGVLRAGAPRIGQETLLIVDLSDIAKKYAEKMEYLAEIRDGSEKKLADGYWLVCVVGVECGEALITPLYQKLYSQEAPEFVSENAEVLGAIEAVARHVGDKGVYVIDRGGDRRTVIHPLLDAKRRFLIRLVGDRHLIVGGRAMAAEAIAAACPLPYAEPIVCEREGKEVRLTLTFGFREVKLPGRPEPLYLVVVCGFGEKPLMLLTNVPLRRTRKSLWWAVSAYLTRWRIEETIRFIKQSYRLEDIRVLSYRRLQNLVALVLAAACFAAVHLGLLAKLKILAQHALRAAKRLFGIPDFRYYALADGIRTILTRSGRGPIVRPPPPPLDGQLVLNL